MSVEVETSGNTIEEAVSIALEELGVEREDVDVEIVEEASKGFLGIGNRGARVRVRVKPEILTGKPVAAPAPTGVEDYYEVGEIAYEEADPELMQAAHDFIKGVLDRMEIEGTVDVTSSEGAPYVSIDGEDMGLLIGRRGDTLTALQTLLSAYLSKIAGRKVYSILDIQGYRERKKESLEGLAERISERVAMTRKSYTMRPMPAADRRIIHMWVKDHSRVESSSEGAEPNRYVVIYPRD